MLENITTQRFPERWRRLSAHSNLFLSDQESRNAERASAAAYTSRNVASTRRWVGCHYLHEANLGC